MYTFKKIKEILENFESLPKILKNITAMNYMLSKIIIHRKCLEVSATSNKREPLTSI